MTAPAPVKNSKGINKYFFYGSWVFPLAAALFSFISFSVAGFSGSWFLIFIIFLLASLHQLFWKKNPKVGAHVSWVAAGAATGILLDLVLNANWVAAVFTAVILGFWVFGRSSLNAAPTRAW